MKIVLLTILVIFVAAYDVGLACNVVPIDVWGLSPSKHTTKLQKPVNLVVVTHTVTSQCNSDVLCQSVARAIRNSQIAQGFEDISLSFLVGGNGMIYEGAGWKAGAHTLGYNNKSISLSFIGDFREVVPTNAALQTAQNFLSCLVNNRNLTQNYILVGHRQLISTISPGDALMNIIQRWPHWSLNAATRPHSNTLN